MEVIQQQPQPKLRKVYQYLKDKNKVPEATYEDFEASMADQDKLQTVFDYLKKKDVIRAENVEAFRDSVGLKKKEEPSSADQTLAQYDQIAQSIPESQSALPESQVAAPTIPEPVTSEGQPKPSGEFGDIFARLAANLDKPEPTPEELRVQQQVDRQFSDEAKASQFAREIDKKYRPELYREKNPIVTGAKALWNVAIHEIPAAVSSLLAISNSTGTNDGSTPLRFQHVLSPEQKESFKETQTALIEWASERRAKGAKFTEDLVNRLDKVNDPIDALNYVFNAAGHATGHIPLSVVTAGASSMVQEIGSIYLGSVEKIAAEKGLTIKEVIDQGLDEPAFALSYGTAAGLLDRFGAKKVMGSFSKDAFRQSLRSRGLSVASSGGVESTTEYAQTFLEQVGTEQGAGRSFSEALTEVAGSEEKSKERIEGFVQGLIGGTTISSVGAAVSSMRPEQTVQAPKGDLGKPPEVTPADNIVQPQEENAQSEPAASAVPEPDTQDLKRAQDSVQPQQPQPEKNFAVDAQGNPIPVYRGQHGSSDIETRMASISFSDTREDADIYANSPNNKELDAFAKNPNIIEANLSITNPVMNDPQDPFIDFSKIKEILGEEEAKRIAIQYSDHITNTNNWDENYRDYGSVEELLAEKPEELANLYMNAFPIFDDQAIVEKFKRSGYDGAIHAGYGEGIGAEYKVFSKEQINVIKPDQPTAGPPVSSPAEQRADISTEEGRGLPPAQTQAPVGGTVDQAFDRPPEVTDVTDPDELAAMYLDEVNNPSVAAIDVSIAKILTTAKVNRASFINNNDAANITPGMAKSYFDNRGASLDQIAKQASELHSSGNDGDAVSPEDVAEFMIKYKSGPATVTTPSGNPKLAEIANQFATITGKAINRRTAALVLEKSAKRTRDAASKITAKNGALVTQIASSPETVDFSDAAVHDEISALYGLNEEEYVFLSNHYGQARQQDSNEGGDQHRDSLIPDAQSEETSISEGGAVQERIGRSPQDREALVQEIKGKRLTHVHGLNMGGGVAQGTYLSTEATNRYSDPGKEISSAEVDISSPQVFTEDDDINSFRNQVLADNFSAFDDSDFEGGAKPPSGSTISIDELSDSGVDKLAGLVRSQLIAEGHDSIYFPESETQEGELVVFDAGKVTLTPITQPTTQDDSTTDNPPLQSGQPDTQGVSPVNENLQPDETNHESEPEGAIPTGSEVEFEWLNDRKTGKVLDYSGGRARIKGIDGTIYRKPIGQFDRIGVTAKKAAPKDAEKSVKFNSKRKKPIGIVGDPSAGFMFMTDLGDKIAAFFKKQFTSKGFLPQYVFDRWIGAKGDISVYENQIRFTVSDFKKAIKNEYDGKLTDEQITDLNLYLQGKQTTNPVAPETAKILDVMRAQIDNLSRRFIDEGIISGDIQATFTKNLGVYLTRSYRKFDDPFWAEFVPPEVRNKAEAFIRNNAAAKGEVITDEEVEGLINYILYDPKAPMSVLSGSKLGSKDLSILKKRGDIAPEIRALMGEYSDPLLNYARSVTKMITLIAKHHFLTDVRLNGTGKFLFDKPTGKYSVKLASDGSKTMAPMNGLYTSREIADAFNEFNSQEALPPWLKVYMKAISIVKANKTVFSVQTHARNIVGNLGFVVMNGHWRVNEAGKATQVAWALLYNSDQKIRDKFLEYVQLGIVQDSAVGGELRQYIKDVRNGKDFFETLGERSLTKASHKILDVTQKAYQAEDDMFKIYAFENEYARYRKAYPNKTDAEVKRMAADIVTNTYPTYSRVPKIIKGLRANPLVGTFVAFPAEVFRTTYNTMELAAKEMSTPETRGIGAQRTAGILGALLLPTAASMTTMWSLGLDGDDDDDIRKFAAPWQKDSEFLYMKTDKDKYTIIDLGYSDPHNYLKRPIYQFLSEGPLLENGIDAAQALARPFLDENILTERLIDIHRNKKATGDHVYNTDASVGDQLSAIYSHLWPVTEPGTIASLRRIRKGMLGETDKYGKEYSATGELMSVVTGQKEETKDITQALLYRVYEIKDRIEATNKDYFRTIKNQEATQAQKDEAERVKNEATAKIVADAQDIYLSALRLGVDPRVARRYMILTKNEQIFRATAGAK